MQTHTSLNNWLPFEPESAIDIKPEPIMDSSVFALLSPPSSPSISRSVPTNRPAYHPTDTPSQRRYSTSGLATPKRPRPYPITPRDQKLRADNSGRMSNSSYPSWPPHGLKPSNTKCHNTGERRSMDIDQSSSFADAIMNTHPSSNPTSRHIPSHGPQSLMSTSSLTGAMGESPLSTESLSQHSDSPSPPLDQTPYPIDPTAGIVWPSSQANTGQHGYQSVAPQTPNISYQTHPSTPPISGSSGPYLHYQDYNTSYHNPSPDSFDANSSAYGTTSYNDPSTLPTPRPVIQRTPAPCIPGPTYCESSLTTPVRNRPASATQDYEMEVRSLRKRVRELEIIHESARQRVRELESVVARGRPTPHHGSSTTSTSSPPSGGVGLPSPLLTPSPVSPSFQASWKIRTEARLRSFCSQNRAGNALCAWHDSRRERRAHPPRMAPPGYLNCGCTYEEALFEESLARHGVGSYLPGESVRMDPALRNPLLKLLQRRYNYQDGDFERDPVTGGWVDGEGHQIWEQRALAGSSHSRKSKTEERR